ncbi:glycosyl transferase, group 1 [Cronobacter condimenti 1330]|uniref:Glycosyl transferase family 1 n=1 Tax=Cronobacter condimenti 1330 TaxID=1073999 RepID=K8A4R1_9ENTR|nr:glycosyltransferase [Cronobacter condimenti]ALB63276.1 glycosyl transferase family 1 [Cronobacter condimenti 1330]CCJ74775.1 glycosyl transferase, group 1 [Cronobacter condimenti 1330]
MKKTKIVFNCSTNVVGGGVQNSVNFIKEVINNKGYGLEWFYILSPQVYEQLKELIVQDSFYVSYHSPASSFLARMKIKALVKSLRPKLVYTSAGPAYIRFSISHIMGCSNPYILGASDYAYSLYGNKKEQLKIKFKTLYQRIQIKKADVWIAQTEASKFQLQKLIGKNAPIHVIYNSVSKDFLDFLDYKLIDPNFYKTNEQPCLILVPTAYYKHKDLEGIPKAAALLKEKYNPNFKIILTIGSQDDYRTILDIAKTHGVDDLFQNIGSFAHSQAIHIYSKYDVVLQPSALEVFSTSYIEAMATLKPLVVPDYNFSRSICCDYAYYYQSGDSESYADALYQAMQDKNIERRFDKATKIVKKYGSQEQRVKTIVELIKEYLVKNEGKNV